MNDWDKIKDAISNFGRATKVMADSIKDAAMGIKGLKATIEFGESSDPDPLELINKQEKDRKWWANMMNKKYNRDFSDIGLDKTNPDSDPVRARVRTLMGEGNMLFDCPQCASSASLKKNPFHDYHSTTPSHVCTHCQKEWWNDELEDILVKRTKRGESLGDYTVNYADEFRKKIADIGNKSKDQLLADLEKEMDKLKKGVGASNLRIASRSDIMNADPLDELKNMTDTDVKDAVRRINKESDNDLKALEELHRQIEESAKNLMDMCQFGEITPKEAVQHWGAMKKEIVKGVLEIMQENVERRLTQITRDAEAQIYQKLADDVYQGKMPALPVNYGWDGVVGGILFIRDVNEQNAPSELLLSLGEYLDRMDENWGELLSAQAKKLESLAQGYRIMARSVNGKK